MMSKRPIKGMYVIKRDGRKEEVHLDKITSRIQKLCYGLNADFVDPVAITLSVVKGLYSGVTTVELDMLSAETAASKTSDHPDYGVLAARIAISNLHKETKKQFSEVVDDLYNRKNSSGRHVPLVSEKFHQTVMKNADKLNSCIIYDRDFSYTYFSFKILEQDFLLRINGKIVERPQHMLMRVSVGIHGDDIESAIETYNYLSERYYMHSTTTLQMAGAPQAQLSSSYSLMMPDDSIEGIMKCLSQCATITKATADISVNLHNIRAKGSYIAGTNGTSNGLQPLLRVFNNLSTYVDQNRNSKPGMITIYLEPWHADIKDFLNLKRTMGKAEVLASDLCYALWIPDLFMKRVNDNGMWSLMCPHESPGLSDCWGEKFEQLYVKYEQEKKYRKQIPARDLWRDVLVSQMETGSPYLLYKDSCNRKSNQQHLGTIKGSSFHADAVQFTSPDEIGVCSSASIALNMFVSSDRKTFDFEHLKAVTKIVTKNLDKMIDINDYPEIEAKNSSIKHRSVGVSVQGFADALILMRLAYDGKEARLLNKQIFETLYYGALEASCELAEKFGPHPSYEGSFVSKGLLQFDLWGVTPTSLWDWTVLKAKIAKNGVRNSLLIAVRVEETIADILGINKSFEPNRSNVSIHHVLSSEYRFVNKLLVKDLMERNLWDDDLKMKIINNNGNIQNIDGISDDIKMVYKTVWDFSNKTIMDMALDRSAFIDQSQSLQLYVPTKYLNAGSINSMHFHGWKSGLKTGVYIFHKETTTVSTQNAKYVTRKVEQQNITNVDKKVNETVDAVLACSLNNPESCEMCSA